MKQIQESVCILQSIHQALRWILTIVLPFPMDVRVNMSRSSPELKAISFFHHGAYEEIPEIRKRLISHAEENNLKLTGVFRNVYLEGPPQHKDKSKFITQIIAIIE